MSAAVRGIQGQGVIATAKHYILNNQEYQRVRARVMLASVASVQLPRSPFVVSVGPIQGNMSSDVDERTLVQIYLPPFEAAVRAGVGAVMCGYNKINGQV